MKPFLLIIEIKAGKFLKANFKIIDSIILRDKHRVPKNAHIIFRLFQLYKKALFFIKFNLLKMQRSENLVPLGGINLINLNKLNLVKSNFGLM